MPDADEVLITRPLAQAQQTADRVAALGLRPVIAPLLEVHRIPAALPDHADAVLLTSGNAVAALPRWAGDGPVFAVGDATAALVCTAGFSNVFSANGDVTVLAALVQARQPAGTLLLLTGEGQGAALETALREQGRTITRCAVYRSAPVPALPHPARGALAGGRLRAALFFSAETARAFVRLVHAADLAETTRTVTACAIGKPAGMALEPLPWRQVRIAARPTQDEMLALLR